LAEIAISTCAYLDLPLAAALQRIAALCDAAEVRCKGPHALETPAGIRAVAGSGLRCSVHAPEEIDIWSGDHRLREAGIAAHERLLDACAAAGAELYVVHPDYSDSGVVPCVETRAALQESFAALHELERFYPVRIVVENMPGPWHSNFVAPDIDMRGLGLALDAGHAQISGTLEAFLESSKIVHAHLHDNLGFGGPDLHLPLGRGCLPRHRLRRVLEGCDGLCVLEHENEADVKVSLGYLDRIARAEAAPSAA
jgi:sugar phosphate isomerase/epimerase